MISKFTDCYSSSGWCNVALNKLNRSIDRSFVVTAFIFFEVYQRCKFDFKILAHLFLKVFKTCIYLTKNGFFCQTLVLCALFDLWILLELYYAPWCNINEDNCTFLHLQQYHTSEP